MNDWLTVREIAEFLLISRSRAYELGRREGLPMFRLSKGRIRVRREDFERWLQERLSRPAYPKQEE